MRKARESVLGRLSATVSHIYDSHLIVMSTLRGSYYYILFTD